MGRGTGSQGATPGQNVAPQAGGVPSQLPELGGQRPDMPSMGGGMGSGEMLSAFQSKFPGMNWDELRASLGPAQQRGFGRGRPQFSPGSSAQMFRANSLPITASESVAGTGASPVAQAGEGASAVTDPSSFTGAAPQGGTGYNPSEGNQQGAASPQDLVRTLRNRYVGQRGQ